MTTSAYAVKGALFDRLIAYAAPAQPLAGLQVAYAFPGATVDLECLYGGGVRFDQKDMIAESPGLMIDEEVLVSLYIRVVARPAGDVRTTDTRAGAIGAQLGALLRAEPRLAGGNTILGITSGAGDYSQTDDETTSILAYQVRVSTNLTYAGGP